MIEDDTRPMHWRKWTRIAFRLHIVRQLGYFLFRFTSNGRCCASCLLLNSLKSLAAKRNDFNAMGNCMKMRPTRRRRSEQIKCWSKSRNYMEQIYDSVCGLGFGFHCTLQPMIPTDMISILDSLIPNCCHKLLTRFSVVYLYFECCARDPDLFQILIWEDGKLAHFVHWLNGIWSLLLKQK